MNRGTGSALLLALALLGVGNRGSAAPEPLVRAVDAVAIPVTDVGRALAFYRDVLHFREVSDHSVGGDSFGLLFGVQDLRLRAVRMRLGRESIELQQYLSPPGRPLPADARSDDRWFEHIAIVVSDMDTAYAWLREHHVTAVSAGPQVLPAWNPAAGGIAAFYFRDPDGNPLEVLHFPPGKGAPRWQQHSRTLFLGIDHTAIAVADTAASLAYYHDALGLRVAGRSDNFGTEQERLSGVPGAHVRITTLRAAAGPGIELLEYLMPRTGRAYPADTRAGDRWQWVVSLRARAGSGSEALVPLRHWRWISRQPGELADDTLGFRRALMLRDPDGHADTLILR